MGPKDPILALKGIAKKDPCRFGLPEMASQSGPLRTLRAYYVPLAFVSVSFALLGAYPSLAKAPSGYRTEGPQYPNIGYVGLLS